MRLTETSSRSTDDTVYLRYSKFPATQPLCAYQRDSAGMQTQRRFTKRIDFRVKPAQPARVRAGVRRAKS